MIWLSLVTIFLGYVFLYAGVEGGELAQHPWRGVTGG